MKFSVGDALPVMIIPCVDAQKMKIMALILNDPNPIHFDPATVQRLGLGDHTINQGTNSVAYLINMLIAAGGSKSKVQRIKVRFLDNVFADDHLEASGIVTAVQSGEVDCNVFLRRGDEVIVHGNATLAWA